jgi:hypothetical protein
MKLMMTVLAIMGCVYAVALYIIHVDLDHKILACSIDYTKVPTNYKKLCYKEYKNERLRTKYY